MSVVLKNVFIFGHRQDKQPKFNVKRFCFVPKYEIANFKKRRDGENTTLTVLYSRNAVSHCRIYQTAWVYCFFNLPYY